MIIPGILSVAGAQNLPAAPLSANIRGHDIEYVADGKILFTYREDEIPGNSESCVGKAALINLSDPENPTMSDVLVLDDMLTGLPIYKAPHIAILNSSRALVAGSNQDDDVINVYLLDISGANPLLLDEITITQVDATSKRFDQKAVSTTSALFAYTDNVSGDGQAVMVDATADTLSVGTAVTLNTSSLVSNSAVAVLTSALAYVCSGDRLYHLSIAGMTLTVNDNAALGDHAAQESFMARIDDTRFLLVYQATDGFIILRYVQDSGTMSAGAGTPFTLAEDSLSVSFYNHLALVRENKAVLSYSVSSGGTDEAKYIIIGIDDDGIYLDDYTAIASERAGSTDIQHAIPARVDGRTAVIGYQDEPSKAIGLAFITLNIATNAAFSSGFGAGFAKGA